MSQKSSVLNQSLFVLLMLTADSHSGFQGFSLTLNLASEAEAQKIFAALSDGGQIRMPLAKTFFSPCFGMLADRFGVAWMIIVRP